MENLLENIEIFLNTNVSEPSLIVDEEGNVFKRNSLFENRFGESIDFLFDIFSQEDAEKVAHTLLRMGNEPVTVEVSLHTNIGEGKYLLKISPVTGDAKRYFIISFSPLENSMERNVRFRYLAEEPEEFIEDARIIELLNKIKSNYPFTIIGKNIVQNEANKLSGYFWIKDAERKYVLVNKKYAEYLGAKPSSVEGLPESEFLPPHIEKMLANTDAYILETGNATIIEGLGKQFLPPGEAIIEFPLLDIDDNVIAIVGLSYRRGDERKEKSEAEQNENENLINESVEMYDEILRQFPEPIFIYDVENLRFLEVNKAALDLYGYTREEFLGMDLTDLYAPEDIQSLIESGTNGKSKYGGPWRQKRKDGSSVIVQISRIPIEYEGRAAHMSVIKDLTSKTELDKKIQLYKAAFENSGDAILITDMHGFVKYSNDNFAKYFGFPKSDVEQSTFLSFVADEDRGNVNKAVFQSPVPDVKTMEIKIKKSDGELLPAKVISSPIFDFEDKVERYVLIIKPIFSESRTGVITETTTRGIDPGFLSNLFHELLTPLNVIIGFVQELSESIQNPTEDQREAIQIIKENQKVLMQTMDTAVEYSLLEQNMIELSPKEITFVDLLEHLENSTKKISDSNEVVLSYGKISSSLKFVTDRQKFLTFLVQILHFAITMTRESKIFLSANYVDNEKFYVGIKDTKNGISEDLFKNLNSVFKDDENNIRRNFGLSRFTVRLVKKLLGILKAEYTGLPSEDSPNEFALIFPLRLEVSEKEEETIAEEKPREKEKTEEIKEIPEEEKPEEKEIPEKSVPSTTSKKTLDMSKLSCLYLEDQIDSQILFRAQMKELNSIEFATSLEKALPLLKSKKFDFILMDINLQGEYNGLDALKIIRQMPGYENIPIIAVTAYVVPGAAEKFIQAGFNEFITKPLLREKIIGALEKVFS